MPLTMNERSSGSNRPRSAKLRRRPNTDITQEIQEESIPDTFKREQSETNRKNAKSKELNLLETSNRLGVKNKLFGKQNQKSNQALTTPASVEFLEPKNGFVNFYQGQTGREPPKSPRILPKLEKEARKANCSAESSTMTNDAPNFSIFLDEKKALDSSSLQLGKHYSVLPNISHTSENRPGNFSS